MHLGCLVAAMLPLSCLAAAIIRKQSCHRRQNGDIICCCRFEDYVGQLEAAAAVAGLSAEKEKTPSIKDRKELAAIQEVLVCPFLLGNVHHLHNHRGFKSNSVSACFDWVLCHTTCHGIACCCCSQRLSPIK